MSDVSKREEKKARFRARILEAARKVFFRDGFMLANLDEVAELAGVAKGTLYRYFENKGDLYVTLLAADGDVFVQKMTDAAAPGPAADRIRRVGSFYFQHWTRHREYFQIFWAVENQRVIGELPAGVVEAVTRLWERSLRILADVIEDGVKKGEFVDCDPWEVATILWTVANGLIQTENVGPRRELRHTPLERLFDDMAELFLRGLAVAPTDHLK